MAYNLTLSKSEYDAIVWHGHRYDLSIALLDVLSWPEDEAEQHTFTLAEHEAWNILDAWENEDGFGLACGSDELNRNLYDFVSSIV